MEYLLNLSISASTIKEGMNRYRSKGYSTWQNIPNTYAHIHGKVLINYDSIDFTKIAPFKDGNVQPPNRELLIAQLYAELEKEREEKANTSMKELTHLWKGYINSTDEKYYQDKYNVNGGRANGTNRAQQLAIGMGILRFLDDMKSKGVINTVTGMESKRELQTAVGELVKGMELYNFPASYDRIREKLKVYKQAKDDPNQDERDVLISNRVGNNNRLRFTEEHKTILLEYYLDPSKSANKLQCWMKYSSYMKKEFAVEPIGLSRFKQITNQKDIKVLAAKVRNGQNWYEINVRPFVLRKPPKYSFSLVAGDGWEPGRSVKRTITRIDETGRKVTRTKVGTMNVWLWYDWKSKAIVSHKVSPTEDGYHIRQSFRDIIGFWGISPLSVMIDKKWEKAQDCKRMFDRAGVEIQHKRGYNPKSNIAERNNKEANKAHRSSDPFWVTMTNHTVNFQHNEEWVRQAKPMEESEFRAMVYDIIARYNNTPLRSLKGRTPWEVLEANKNPECKTFDPLELSWVFNTRHPKPVTVRNYRVQFDIATKRYDFIIPQDYIVAYTQANVVHDKVALYYDEAHMDTVDIYSFEDKDNPDTDRYICSLIPTDDISVNAASVEERPGKKFQEQQERGRQLDSMIDAELEAQQERKQAYDIDQASVQSVSQQRWKEARENNLMQQYRKYHQDAEEMAGHRVADDIDESPTPREIKEKSKKLKKIAEQYK